MQPAHRKCKWDKKSENKLEMKPKGRYNNGEQNTIMARVFVEYLVLTVQ